jgi:hypothetical protein
VSAPWCPAGWCMSGDILFLVTSWEFTQYWDLSLVSTQCDLTLSAGFLHRKVGHRLCALDHHSRYWSWLPANIVFYYAIDNHVPDYALDWLEDLCP